MLQPGSCLPEPLDQLAANNVNEYNTWDYSHTNSGNRPSSVSFLNPLRLSLVIPKRLRKLRMTSQ